MKTGKNFYNWPKPLTAQDYENCVALVKNEAVNNPTVQALYLMGTEWQPGISDLDIVVIYKDLISPQYLKSPWSLGEKARFIFTHRYLSFSEHLARYFYFLYPKKISNLRLIAGNPVPFIEPIIGQGNADENSWTLAFSLFDVFVNKLLLFGRYGWANRETNIRNLIGELYSLRYTVDMIKSLTGTDIGGTFYVEIAELRRDWFNLEESLAADKLLVLLAEGQRLVGRAVTALDNYLISKSADFSNAFFASFSNDKFQISFSQSWAEVEFQKEFKKSIIGKIWFTDKKVESIRLVLPASFTFFFQAYAASSGDFGRMIRQHFSAPATFKIDDLPVGAKKHIEAMNIAFKDSLQTKGKFKIPFSFGFSFEDANLKSWAFMQGVKILRFLKS